MYELAFGLDGSPIEIPVEAAAWLVRRAAPRGRSQLVFTDEGTPFLLPIAAGTAELRRAVEHEGHYLLSAVDEQRRPIAGVRIAHVRLQRINEPEDAVAALRAVSRAAVARAAQLLDQVPVLLNTAQALLRTAEDADVAIEAALNQACPVDRVGEDLELGGVDHVGEDLELGERRP